MKITYNFTKCIICLKNPPGDQEHIIPQSIGGRLKAHVLCTECNKRFGSELIGNLKSVPEIRLAMEHLKDELPSLYWRFLDKAKFVGDAEDGTKIYASNRKPKKKVLPAKGRNGSIILDTKEAKKALETDLERQDFPEEVIAKYKEEFEQLEEEVPLVLPNKNIFIKKHIPVLRPNLETVKMDDRLPTLIAFEFLALLVGKEVLKSSFSPIRSYIDNGKTTEKVKVEHFCGGNEYDTFHAILVTPIENAMRIDIRLFRWITIAVTFYGFDYRGVDSIYLEDMKTSASFFAPTHKDALNGKWIKL